MSFLVLFNTDSSPVDLGRIKGVAPGMTAQNVQVLGLEQQVAFLPLQGVPASLSEDATHWAAFGESLWLIGRIRLDSREELFLDVLKSSATFEQRSDGRIVLAAYARWRDRCLDHVRGDFCFVLWDQTHARLFCGRDQLGVRALYYAKFGNSWILSDCLELVAAQTAVDNDLDDFWIADFLSFGYCKDPERTIYKQVKRLPGAHFLSVSSRGHVVQRYWALENRDPIYYPHARTYVEQFHEIVGRAIKDRLPNGRVGVSMSGGLDSTSLAAIALAATGDASKIIAYTCHFEYLMQDREKHFSSLVARKLGIPHALQAVDEALYDPYWYNRELRTPEPTLAIVDAVPKRIIAAEMAKLANVWFWGEGPDNALQFEWQPYLRWLFQRRDWPHLVTAMVDYLLSKRLTEWGSTVGNSLTRLCAANRTDTTNQSLLWFNETFLKEHRLVERTCRINEPAEDKHPWHPAAVASFTDSAWWSTFFDEFDPMVSGAPLTFRHPYLDLRVLTFLLTVPPIPWARRKRLIRGAMQGCLPKQVLSRDKAPLRRDPSVIGLQTYGLPRLSLDGATLRYVNHTKLPNTVPNEGEGVIIPLLWVYALDKWLKSKLQRFPVEYINDIEKI